MNFYDEVIGFGNNKIYIIRTKNNFKDCAKSLKISPKYQHFDHFLKIFDFLKI